MNTNVTPDTSIAERFRDIATSIPETIAIVSQRRRYTYGELERWSDAIAADILAMNAPRDKPVAVLTRDHVALVPAAIGAVKAGHFFVIIDAADPNDRISTILKASGAALCLTDAQVPSAARHLPSLPIRPLESGSTAVPPQQTPHELIHLIFTSGTTGAPKGIAARQRHFVERLMRRAAVTGRAAGERVSYTALPGFARATGEIFGTLLNGGTLCAFDARSEPLEALVRMIERERISILTITPALFRAFLRALPADADLSSVKKLRIGADVITVADVDAWRAHFPRTTTLERGFNASETAMVLHMSIDHDTPIPGPLVPMGRPLSGVEVWLRDEAGNDVADGEVGELVVRSRSVIHGYWNDPEQTGRSFTFDPEHPDAPTFRTGDLARRDADGLYYFIGRRDSRLKIHGRRIDPLEVETALIAHAGVREAAVVGKPAADGDLGLVAYVVPQKEQTLAPRDVRARLRGVVPSWMIPPQVHVVEALPMSDAGKVDRGALARRVDDAEEPPVAQDETETTDELERMLVALWSRVIGRTVRRDQDFFNDLGGDSLIAAQLVTEVKRVTGRSLPLSLLLELNSVARMAEYLRTRPDVARTVIALQSEGSRPPLFSVSGKGGSVIVFRQLAALLGPDQPFYGLTHHGFDPASFPRTLSAIAAQYADVIRETQPEGPYYLAGYSAGGFIAYEIARQMTQAGDAVAFVGLIDTSATHERSSFWKRHRKYFTLLRQRPGRNAPRFARALARRPMWLLRWLISGGKSSLVPDPTPEVAERNRLFESLAGRTSLQPYDQRVTLFLARFGFGTDAALPDAGWRALCGDGLTIVDVDGEHHTVLNHDVQSLADAFERALAEARERARNDRQHGS